MLMAGIFAEAVTAAALFAGTNVDDMVVLTVLNVSSRAAGRPRLWHIWAGQYAGFAVVVAVSLAAAAGLALVPENWIWPAGLLPLGLGLYKLAAAIRAHSPGESVSPAVVTGLTGVVGLTIANGGDNIAAYTPFFRTSSAASIAATVTIFMAGVAVWCLAAARFAAGQKVTQVIKRWGQWIVPAVYILIGVYIFHKTGALRHLW